MYFRLEGAGWCDCCSQPVPWEDPIPQHVLTSWTWTVPPHLAVWLVNPPEAGGVITVSRPAWRLPFVSRKELKTRSSGLCWPLLLPLAVRTLRSGRKALPLGLDWEGLAQRSSLGGPQSHRPREPRGWGCAEPIVPGASLDLDRVDWLPEACGAPPYPVPLGGAPTPSRAPPLPSAGILPLQGSPNPCGAPPFPLPPWRGSSHGGAPPPQQWSSSLCCCETCEPGSISPCSQHLLLVLNDVIIFHFGPFPGWNLISDIIFLIQFSAVYG